MDVLYFLKDRTRLICQYYESVVRPFKSIKRHACTNGSKKNV